MPQTTITEALADLKTIAKRIDKKKDFVLLYLGRSEGAKDPIKDDGGSPVAITQARQAIADLQERAVTIRRAIQGANSSHSLEIAGRSRTIADWLVWRREVAPQQTQLLGSIRAGVLAARQEAKKRDTRVVEKSGDATDFKDIVINLSESELHAEIEALEETLGTLDGLLSLKNATITIEV